MAVERMEISLPADLGYPYIYWKDWGSKVDVLIETLGELFAEST